MVAQDEDNYREAIESSFKVFAPQGISKYIIVTNASANLHFRSHSIRLFYWIRSIRMN
jgi:amyloid beta precursor protein binding protein 1